MLRKKTTMSSLTLTLIAGLAIPSAALSIGWSDLDPTNKNSAVRKGARELSSH